ncbi:zinc ABC transporter substrate-binding protein [Clostridium gasigenes]|uniref:metal ABC transporter substrate-binding protein n=1 Tax=Clostridium gasigenes TaxID=94869 RepID=UPI001C0D63CB|nr:zinc ABC transporter substrate-binding protein [Clostridium gasigenes]
MKNVTYGLIIITMILFLGLGFFQSPLLANTENEIEAGEEVLLNITTVSKNQYSMVKSIVLNKHNVEYLSENESEIYKFKYNEDIINNISGRDLFIYSGINNEPWVNDFIAELKKGDLGIINMSRGIKTLTYENGNENPYYWLGINEYKIALYNVKSAIQEKDPKNKSYYEENYANVINKIEESAKEVKLELEKYKDYTILTNTNTFDYLLKDLGLTSVNIKKEVTRKILDEKKLDENKIIFVKEKDPIEIVNIIETKKEDDKVEETKKTNEEKLEVPEIEAKKPLDIKSVELIRWDGEKTLVELALSNIKLVTDTLKKLPIVIK